MKAEELMVGDMVRVNRDGLCIKNGTIVKVLGVDGENKLKEKGLIGCAGCQPLDKEQFFGGIWLDYLGPIPITPEILEKNGFDINGIPEDMQPVEERDWSDDTYVWSRQETPDEAIEVCIYMDDPYNFFAEIICQYCHVDGVHIKYVHELQHVLRLCGIEKEIIL